MTTHGGFPPHSNRYVTAIPKEDEYYCYLCLLTQEQNPFSPYLPSLIEDDEALGFPMTNPETLPHLPQLTNGTVANFKIQISLSIHKQPVTQRHG